MYMCSINLSGYEVRNSQNCLGHLMRTAQIDGVVGRRVSSRDFLFSMVLFDCCRWTDSGFYLLVYIWSSFVMRLSFSNRYLVMCSSK